MTVSSPALSFATALVRSWRTREKSKRPCWTFAYRARRPLSSGITCQHAPRRPPARADARRRLPSPRPGAADRGDSVLVDGAVVPAAEQGKFRERGGALHSPGDGGDVPGRSEPAQRQRVGTERRRWV